VKDEQKTLTLIGIILIPVTVATAATLLFLYPYNPTQPPKSDDTGWSEEGAQEVIDANNQFALELYTELSKNGKENIFYSPYSIFAALGMTYEGAKGETKDEIKSVFTFQKIAH